MLFEDDFNVLFGEKKQPKIAKKEEPKEIVYHDYNEAGKVRMHKVLRLDPEKYKDFTTEKYEYSLNFYDFEVFSGGTTGEWMVTILNPLELTRTIIVNNRQALIDYHNAHQQQIYVGYNSKHYDVPIFKGILLGMNPKKVSDDIVIRDTPAWKISKDFRNIPFLNFDIKTTDDSLKQLEAFMGDNIEETSVSFDIDRILTLQEIQESLRYNIHDVDETLEVFRLRTSEYNAYTELIGTFGLPHTSFNKTKAQMTAEILECETVEGRSEDEFDLQFVNCLHVKKYKHIVDWFKNKDNLDYSKGQEDVLVCGIPHTFGWGGLHGCIDHPINRVGRMYHVDVTSYYPSMMIVYKFLTRNCKHPEKFVQIYDTRVALKKAGKKKEQAPYKIVLNGTYGICKDRFNPAYDPRQANNICVNGQLMLLDLLEHLEPYCEIIQSNTDGLIIQIEDSDIAEQNIMNICANWERRTGMGLEKDRITKISQKDVNNYAVLFENGKVDRKGLMLQETNKLKNDLPIVNEALFQYLLFDKTPEETIGNCNELIQFQKVFRVSNKFTLGWHNGKYMTEKTYRVFASKDEKDSYLGRVRDINSNVMKFGMCPDHCFIDNSEVKNKNIPDKLDKQWYINTTWDRIKMFKPELDNKLSNALF